MAYEGLHGPLRLDAPVGIPLVVISLAFAIEIGVLVRSRKGYRLCVVLLLVRRGGAPVMTKSPFAVQRTAASLAIGEMLLLRVSQIASGRQVGSLDPAVAEQILGFLWTFFPLGGEGAWWKGCW